MLDEIDRLLDCLPAATVSQRLDPAEVVYDSVRSVGRLQHYLFITTRLDVGARLMVVTRIGSSSKGRTCASGARSARQPRAILPE